jgi:endoglucanase
MAMLRSLFLLLLLCAAVSPAADVFERHKRLGRGLNMGNALEGPTEGAWGFVIQDEDFPRIKAAGFSSVRIPTKWSAHAAKEAPYAIDPAFMARVDHVVKTALAAGLQVVLNVHHYDELDQEPARHRERYAALWKQVAAHFADFPDALQFELYNEPNTNHSAAEWNLNLAAALKEVRVRNPHRTVQVGGVEWNQVYTLKDLRLPKEDRNLIVHIHYYAPFHFTHKNAPWIKGSSGWTDHASWEGTEAQKAAVRKDFAVARDWAKAEGRPVFLGEFGAARTNPDNASRLRWTRFIRDAAEEHGFTWAYWEYQAYFGVWDPKAKEWRKDLLEALVGK